MRTLCRSFWLVGFCLARVASGTSEVRPHADPPRDAQAPEWRKAELAGGLRLALARGERTERTQLCVAYAVPSLGLEGTPHPNTLVELEMRIEALSSAEELAAGTDSGWRTFDHVDGNTVAFCRSVPKTEFRNALSAMLDITMPVAASSNDCDRAVGQWRQHRGLAELVKPGSNSARLQALSWFGSGAPPPTLASSLQRVVATECEHWRKLPATSPSPTTLALIGDFDLASLESEIRALALRQRWRFARAQHPKPHPIPKVPVQSSPRFVRLRTSESANSAVMMGWPFPHQGERQATGLRALAAVIEQRLNRTLAPAERRASARVSWASGYGTFEVEVRPTQADELSSTEERVFAVIDQLRTNHVSSTEFESALARATSPPSLSGDFELDRALYMAQKALRSWDVHAMNDASANHPKPPELQEWTGRVLSRTNIAEIFVEAIAPHPQRGGARNEGRRPKGLTYVVKPGESLQMIARRFRVTIPELIRVNHLRHPDQIAPGTRLVIPSATPTPLPK